MDNQTQLQGTQNKADLQRDYRQKERLAFRNLLGALNEVERTNARSRREILKRATECLRRLGQEQDDLQKQLEVLPNNATGAGSFQPEAIILSDEDFWWLQSYLAQWQHPCEWPEGSGGL
ncbi:hypothetical protein BDR04DRAFT_1101550 [Suillus decipiens]|nr:hypothetical protein BDR04DRAFT_1101550 [Suillus decipiens]